MAPRSPAGVIARDVPYLDGWLIVILRRGKADLSELQLALDHWALQPVALALPAVCWRPVQRKRLVDNNEKSSRTVLLQCREPLDVAHVPASLCSGGRRRLYLNCRSYMLRVDLGHSVARPTASPLQSHRVTRA